MRRARLSDLAEAVCDGTPVDWAAVGSYPGGHQDSAVDELRRLATVHFPRSESRRADTRAERLPLLGVLVVIVAMVHAGTGFVGFVVGAPDGRAVPAALQALVIAALTGASVFLLALVRGDRRAFMLAGLFMTLAAACSRRFFPIAGPDAGLTSAAAWLAVSPDALLPAFTWAFVRRFPNVTAFGTADRLISLAIAASVVVGATLVLANATLTFAPGRDVALWASPLARGGTGWYWLLIAGLTLPALAILPARVRTATPDERNRVGWFLAGIALGLLPAMIEVTLEGLIPAYDRWTDRPGVAPVIAWLLYVPLLTVPLTATYAVAARQALGIRVAMHRAAQYALARVTLAGLTTVPFVVLATRAYGDRHLTVAELASSPSGVVLVTAATAGTLLLAMRGVLLRWLDRRFGTVRDDLSRRAAAAVEAIRASRGQQDLAAIASDHIGSALDVDRVVVFTFDPASRAYAPRQAECSAVPYDSALARIAEETDGVVDLCGGRPPLWLALPAPDREWVRAMQLALVVSLRAPSNGDTLGLLAVSGRRGGLPFVDEELAFVNTIAGAVALATPRLTGPEADEEPAGECPACGLVRPAGDERCACGGRMVSAAVPSTVAGKFAIRRVLGRGGMGIVYAADDLVLHREVAVKALPRTSRRAVGQLRSEAKAMAMGAHPNLVAVHGVEFWRDVPMLIIERVDGTLADRLAQGPLPVPDVIEIARSLGAALAYLHARDIVHLDVKPSNIGFGRDGRIKLMDFGVATLAGDTGPGAGGTPLYLSPERARGGLPDHHADLWAMAVVLWESLAGRHPFAGSRDLDALSRRFVAGAPDLHALCPACPPGVARAIEGALAPELSLRPRCAREFAEAVATGLDK